MIAEINLNKYEQFVLDIPNYRLGYATGGTKAKSSISMKPNNQ